MTAPDPALITWAEQQDAVRGSVIDAVGLRAGGAPWMLTFSGDGPTTAVLRAGDDAGAVRVERAAMVWADAGGIPVPRVLSDDAGHEPWLLIEPISGTSRIPSEVRTRRLESMGAIAARIHAVPPPQLPRRVRSVNGVDFVPLWDASRHPLRSRARAAIADLDPDRRDDGFVHGDLWMGNVLWRDDDLAAVIDWDCSGRGPAGVDLGSARCDAATAYGVASADDVLRGWVREAGHAPADLARWDVVAALCTPPDMGWFTTAIQQQGRQDLTREVLVERRDAFLARALDALGV